MAQLEVESLRKIRHRLKVADEKNEAAHAWREKGENSQGEGVSFSQNLIH